MLSVLGYIAGFLGLVANVPYIIDTLRGKTKPHRISWAVFLLMNLVNLANQVASGASSSLWVIVGFSISQFVIVILAAKRGVGGLAKLDILCLAGAILGIVLWLYFKTPMVSIVCNIIAATIALVPTLLKAYIAPKTETKATWLLGGIGALLAALSVGSLNLSLLLFPLYSAMAQLAVYALLEYRLTHHHVRYRKRLLALLRQVS
jgi:hypothetical protein